MWRRWSAGAGSALLVGLLVTLAMQEELATPGLSRILPEAVPDAASWEKTSGAAEFSSPSHVVEYELYVSPLRGGVYTLSHYRITFSDAAEQAHHGISPNEMLQWDVDGKTVRRFECAGDSGAGGPCAWRELARDSREFERETRNLLLVYALHRRLLRDRDAGR